MNEIELPERLIATTQIVDTVQANQCATCELLRRSDIRSVLTPGGEIGADVWRSVDIFGLSVNIYLCNIADLPIDSNRRDVQYIVKDYTKFISNAQIGQYSTPIVAQRDNCTILRMRVGSIKGINGEYPFGKGSLDETVYNYKLEVVADPLVLNGFHYLIEVLSNESGAWSPIGQKSFKKNYIRSLATDIRSRLIDLGAIEHVGSVTW